MLACSDDGSSSSSSGTTGTTSSSSGESGSSSSGAASSSSSGALSSTSSSSSSSSGANGDRCDAAAERVEARYRECEVEYVLLDSGAPPPCTEQRAAEAEALADCVAPVSCAALRGDADAPDRDAYFACLAP